MDVVRFHREHRRTVFPTFLMAKQKIVWVISSTIIKYSLAELYQSGFQPISARVEPRLWLVQIWRHTSVFKQRIENLTNVSFVKLSKLFCSFMRVNFFLRFDADNALSVTFHFPGEYLSINCCENCFCLKLLIRDFCEPFSGSF